jgi:hypothetical protein
MINQLGGGLTASPISRKGTSVEEIITDLQSLAVQSTPV